MKTKNPNCNYINPKKETVAAEEEEERKNETFGRDRNERGIRKALQIRRKQSQKPR